MNAERPRLGSFLSFFFLGFLALPLPSVASSGEAFGLALLFLAGLLASPFVAGIADGVGFGFLGCTSQAVSVCSVAWVSHGYCDVCAVDAM